MESIFAFISSLTPNQVIALTLSCMIIIGVATHIATGSLLLGFLALEQLNILNITIHVTSWLDLGLQPFMPMWLSIFLLVLPIIIIVVYSQHNLNHSSNPSVTEEGSNQPE